MSTRFRVVIAGAYVALSSACVHPTSTGERIDRNLITQEQMAASKYLTAYDAVQALRSNWLSTRGPDSFATPSQVRVYLDNTLLGGVESLKTVTVSTVIYIKHFDGISATARWGLDHGAGVIFVSTRPASATDPR